jgi:hypothetical protein
MKQMSKVAMHGFAVFTLVALGSAVLSAQSSPPATNNRAGGMRIEGATVSVLNNRTLIRSAISSDHPSVGIALAPGDQGLDGVTKMTCPATPGTCTIVAEMNVQLGFGTNSPSFLLCFEVDGNFVDGDCPLLGVIPTSNWTSASFARATQVSSGTHNVQTIISTTDAAFRGFYTITYRVYKP